MSDTIVYELTHVQQSSEKDCWAAAIAMLLGRSVGPNRSKLDSEGGLLPTAAKLCAFAASYNLKILPAGRSWTAQALAEILALGPILTMGEYSDTIQYTPEWGDNLWKLVPRFGYKDPREFVKDFCEHNASVKHPNLIIAGRTYTVPRKWWHAIVIAGIRNGIDIFLHDPLVPAPRWASYSWFMSRYPRAAPIIMQWNF